MNNHLAIHGDIIFSLLGAIAVVRPLMAALAMYSLKHS